MYFSADAGDGYHIWRQHLSGDVPEQLTFGATEEEGIAVSPDGHSLVTSAGIREIPFGCTTPEGIARSLKKASQACQGLDMAAGPPPIRSFRPTGRACSISYERKPLAPSTQGNSG
jgi:hypothetical protein